MSGEDWCPFPNGEIGNCHERRPHHHYNPRPGAAWEIVYTDGVEPTTDRSTAPDAEFAAVLERIEAAPEAEEGLRERVADVLWANALATVHMANDLGPEATAKEREVYRRRRYLILADAAIAVLRGRA